MKNFIFIFLLSLCVIGLFIGVIWTTFRPVKIQLKDDIYLVDVRGQSLTISKENHFDTLIFSGYRNCASVCSRTLPILESMAKDPNLKETQIVFLDLTDAQAKVEILTPKQFPHIRWIYPPKSKLRETLSLLGLDRSDTNHHSARLLIHKRHSDTLTWREKIDSDFPKEWAKTF